MKPKKILFLNPYPENKAPSQRLKYEQYYGEFIKDGWVIDKNSFINNEFWTFIYKPGNYLKKALFTFLAYIKRLFFILFNARKYDVVYVHLWVTPLGFPITEWLLVLLSKRLIYDIDDLVYLNHSSAANSKFSILKGSKKMIYLMKSADHVITCTPKLDSFVRKFNLNTTDISSTVDTINRYLPKNNYKLNSAPIIGWSGSVTTSKYLYLLEKPLQKLSKQFNFKLVVLGDKNFNIEGVNVEAYDWTEEIELKVISSFDIGLYPLPNEEWVFGKSGLKAIQYMAMGIPTIATAIGTNFRVIENNVDGLLVSYENMEEWETAIATLLTDESLRTQIGGNGRKKVEDNFSIHVNKETYLKILNG